MIPILYDYSETEWTSNGLGRLSDCISCVVTEERNGIYECEFEYPITGIHYADIVEGRIIGVIHDDAKEIEPFDIYKRSAEINGIVTFYAHHVSYRLSYITLKPFTASSCAGTMASLPANSINNNPFTFSTDKTTSGNYNLETPTAIREMLCGSQGSILDVYGTGEYEFRKFGVYLWTHRGQDSGVEVRYGKNMLDLTKDYDISGSYNAVAPFWYSADGTLITLPEEIIISPTIINTGSEPWTTENLAGMTDENGTQIDFDYAVINVVPMDLSAEFVDVPTVDQLRAKAASRLANSSAWLPDENLKIDFVALWQTEEYKDVAPLQRVSLCDTVSVFFPQMGVNAVKAKVIKTVYNVLLECYDKMELGNAQYSFAEVVSDTTANKLSRTMASKGFLTASLDRATKLIQGGLGGHVVFNTNADGEPQEILVMDTDDINTAVNVIRINKNGIGFSRDGYAGEYITAWTIDGHFVADFIDTGTLSANILRGGMIRSLDGSIYWDLNTGVLRTKSGKNITQLSGGNLDIFVDNNDTEVATASLRPIAWDNDYENGRGVMLTTRTGAKYLSLAHQTGSGYAADLIINNGLNPNGRTQKVQLLGTTLLDGATTVSGQLDVTGKVEITGDTTIGGSTTIRDDLTVATNAYFRQMAHIYTGFGLETTSHDDATASNSAHIIVETYNGIVREAAGVLQLTPGNETFVYIGKDISSFSSYDYTWGTEKNATLYVDGYAVCSGLRPRVNGESIGSSDFKWFEVWAQYFQFTSEAYFRYYSSNDYIYASKTIQQASDENLKDIVPYDDKYDDLLDILEPILYTWKSHPEGERHVGLGARKTAKLLEDCGIENSGFVCVNDDKGGNEIYSIDYNELSTMLLHKVQKQQEEIKELKTMLDAVLERLERLEA